MDLVDVSCVVHVHTTYSDGTATVEELMAAAAGAGADAVLLTRRATGLAMAAPTAPPVRRTESTGVATNRLRLRSGHPSSLAFCAANSSSVRMPWACRLPSSLSAVTAS